MRGGEREADAVEVACTCGRVALYVGLFVEETHVTAVIARSGTGCALRLSDMANVCMYKVSSFWIHSRYNRVDRI